MARTTALLCVALALSPAAHAQESQAEQQVEPGASPENAEATRQAREHFVQGSEHFRAHRYRDAIRSFELAAQLVPSAALSFNIARSYEELSEHEAAIEYYQRYLRDQVDPPDRAQVEHHIEELRERAEAQRQARRSQPTTGVLRLSANRDGAGVELDGAGAGTTPWAETRELTPGRHDLGVEREGYVPFRSQVSIEPGLTTAAYADLVAETRYRSIQGTPIFAWVVWGLGVGALGTSIGMGVYAATLTGSDLPNARTWAAWSDGMLGGAIGLAAVGLALYFLESQSVGTERVRAADEQAPTGVRE